MTRIPNNRFYVNRSIKKPVPHITIKKDLPAKYLKKEKKKIRKEKEEYRER